MCLQQRNIVFFSLPTISKEEQLNIELPFVVPKLVTDICIFPSASNYRILQHAFYLLIFSLPLLTLLLIFSLILIKKNPAVYVFFEMISNTLTETGYKQTPTYSSNKNSYIFKFIDLNMKVYLKKNGFTIHLACLVKKYSTCFL